MPAFIFNPFDTKYLVAFEYAIGCVIGCAGVWLTGCAGRSCGHAFMRACMHACVMRLVTFCISL